MLTAEVATKIAALTAGYTVSRGKMPASPDKIVALFETGGTGPEFFMGEAGVGVDQPGLQLRVRGEADDYDGPRLTIEQLYQAICGYGAFVVSGVRYLSFTPLQAPFPLRRDENQRVEFAVNFLVQKEPSPA